MNLKKKNISPVLQVAASKMTSNANPAHKAAGTGAVAKAAHSGFVAKPTAQTGDFLKNTYNLDGAVPKVGPNNVLDLAAAKLPAGSSPVYKNGGTGAVAKSPTAAGSGTAQINPAGINQSYYSQPSTSDNYDQSKPVYTASGQLTAAGQALADAEANKPGAYQSSYADRIDGMINDILNQKPFQYDAAADPLYQQYAQQYQRGGELAMKDAMAQSAGLTGGYGNTYAQMAGQQGYQRYMEDLNAMLPQLQQAAYQMYQDQGNAMRANLGMLQNADQVDYGRYRDSVGDWQDERGYLYGKYNDMSQDEYNRYLNDRQSWESDRDYWYQAAQDAAAQAWQQQQFEYQQQQDQLDREWAQQQFEYQKQQDALAQQQSSRRSSSSSSGSKKPQNIENGIGFMQAAQAAAAAAANANRQVLAKPNTDTYVGSDPRKRHTSEANQNTTTRYLYDR